MENESNISKPLMPEDVCPGDYVSVLNTTVELLHCVDPSQWTGSTVEPKRAVMLPHKSSVMRVMDVCLPFVLAKRTDGKHVTIDLRRDRLARLTARFGRRAFQRLKPKPAESGESKSKTLVTE